MSSRNTALAHLRKAREFVDAASSNAELGLHNAATSAAVTSGINSKDALCLVLTGRTAKSDAHSDAVKELRSAGPGMAPHAVTLGRLLKLKNRSQYDTRDVTKADARRAIEWAGRLLDAASEAARA